MLSGLFAYERHHTIWNYEYWLSGFSFSPTKPGLWPCSPLAYDTCKNFPGIELALDIENLSLDLIRPDDCTPMLNICTGAWTFAQRLDPPWWLHEEGEMIVGQSAHAASCCRSCCSVAVLLGGPWSYLPPPLVSHCLYTFPDLEKQMTKIYNPNDKTLQAKPNIKWMSTQRFLLSWVLPDENSTSDAALVPLFVTLTNKLIHKTNRILTFNLWALLPVVVPHLPVENSASSVHCTCCVLQIKCRSHLPVENSIHCTCRSVAITHYEKIQLVQRVIIWHSRYKLKNCWSFSSHCHVLVVLIMHFWVILQCNCGMCTPTNKRFQYWYCFLEFNWYILHFLFGAICLLLHQLFSGAVYRCKKSLNAVQSR